MASEETLREIEEYNDGLRLSEAGLYIVEEEPAQEAEPEGEPGANHVPGLWNLLILPLTPPKQSQGGIILPEVVAEANDYFCAVGKVIAMGELCFKGDRFRDLAEPPVKVGDYITYSAHAGIWIKERDHKTGIITKYKLIHDDNYLTTVEDPTVIIGYVK